MSQSLAQIYLHVVFSTKHRVPYLQDPALRERTHGYLAGACHNLGSPSIIVGGVEDHVHVLCRLSKTLGASELVRELKRESSKWLKEQSAELASFYWQSGYGAFSISPGHLEKLKEYIANQEAHHKTETFQTEFLRLLALYQIAYDEKYLWD
jgi:REP element-mobilizing transposase RayT